MKSTPRFSFGTRELIFLLPGGLPAAGSDLCTCFVALGCHDRIPETGGRNNICFLIVLEVPTDLVSGEGSFLAYRWLPS